MPAKPTTDKPAQLTLGGGAQRRRQRKTGPGRARAPGTNRVPISVDRLRAASFSLQSAQRLVKGSGKKTEEEKQKK